MLTRTTMSRLRKIKAVSVALATGATLSLGLAPAHAQAQSSVAAPTKVSAGPCGYYVEWLIARYNHCSPDGSNVWVQVTSIIAPDSPPGLGGGLTLLCVAPGDHSLVPYVNGIITGAHSSGNKCSNPNVR